MRPTRESGTAGWRAAGKRRGRESEACEKFAGTKVARRIRTREAESCDFSWRVRAGKGESVKVKYSSEWNTQRRRYDSAISPSYGE